MSRRELANFIGIVLPPAGLVVAIVLLWNRMVGPVELAILAAGYLLAGVGITVGYHRLFTHRSFRTYPAVRYAFAVLGQFAVEGNVVSWVTNHRKHHQFSDRDGDPHSPHAGYGEGFVEGLRGLWHAHTGWLFDKDATGDSRRYAKDLLDDRGLRIIAKLFVPIVLLDEWNAGVYGIPDAKTIAAIRLCARLEGMLTDPVYEGKSMAALIDLVRSGRIEPGAHVLYAHLGGQPALNAYSGAF